MHPAAYSWVERHSLTNHESVLEIGSLDVNGGVRDLFPHANVYIGLNDVPGPGVDVVADAATYRPSHLFDVVVSTEVLEHANQWKNIILMCLDALAPQGVLILTCAGPGRGPHGQHGAEAPEPGEWYRNVAGWEIADVVNDLGYGHGLSEFHWRQVGTDTQVFAKAI